MTSFDKNVTNNL